MVPVSGLTGPCPEMNTKSPARTAWEYGPAGAGPFSAITVFLIGSPFLSLCLFSPHKCARFCRFRPVDEDMRDPGEDVRERAVESRVRLLGLIVKAVRGDEIYFPPFRLPQSCCLRSRRLRRTRGSSSTSRSFSSTRSNTAASYLTFPRAATRVSSTIPSSPPGIPRRAGSPYYRYGWGLSATCHQLRGRSLRPQRASHAPL